MVRSGGALPAPGEVEELFAMSSAGGGEVGSAESAELFATLYDLALDRTDIVAVTAREVGELVGFGYGHRWRWAEQTDEWSTELARQLAEAAPRLDDTFAVQLLAVHPGFTRHGLGFELLKQLMIASAADVMWLQTADVDSPARRLFSRMGYRPLGNGGVVLVYG